MRAKDTQDIKNKASTCSLPHDLLGFLYYWSRILTSFVGSVFSAASSRISLISDLAWFFMAFIIYGVLCSLMVGILFQFSLVSLGRSLLCCIQMILVIERRENSLSKLFYKQRNFRETNKVTYLFICLDLSVFISLLYSRWTGYGRNLFFILVFWGCSLPLLHGGFSFIYLLHLKCQSFWKTFLCCVAGYSSSAYSLQGVGFFILGLDLAFNDCPSLIWFTWLLFLCCCIVFNGGTSENLLKFFGSLFFQVFMVQSFIAIEFSICPFNFVIKCLIRCIIRLIADHFRLLAAPYQSVFCI
ncbi:unnamed protein product [Ilex paraguariensis]|uniref:Uncharacterized protein n=1 Tax=Ilex paraguariensis TaxID=185542 RepID=A0ABC8R2Z9_9AQUA